MSLQILNDEDVTSEKSTENCDFLFSPPELTGRLSVLCLSQKENVPPKNLAKAMKVTFQTPLRDPQTHRILSPSMTSKLEIPFVLDDTIGSENFQHAAASSLSGGHTCGADGRGKLEVFRHIGSHELSRQ
uniref:Transforming acidic coiled-coil containing protein 3 n=1 Tax=Propithecus coquereli TaxID=379532 RepID=A0A2K6GCX7_PROCO